jgi:hypothetical protein
MCDAFSKQTGKRFKTQQVLTNNPGLVKHASNLRIRRAHMKLRRSRSTFDQQAAQHLGGLFPQRILNFRQMWQSDVTVMSALGH